MSFAPHHRSARLDLGGAARLVAQALADAENLLSASVGGEADALIDGAGQVYLLIGAQEQLRRSEARLKELFACLPDILWVVDAESEIISVNAAAVKILGYDPGALVGRSFMAFCHPDDRESVHHAFSEATSDAASHAVARFRYRAENGDWVRLEATVGGLPSAQTGRFVVSGRRSTLQPAASLNAARDSDQRNLGSAVERSLARISHALRTPLTPVLLTLQDLGADDSLSHLHPAFNMMEDNLRAQLRLIDELRSLAQVDKQNLGGLLEAVDAHAAMEFALHVCAKALEERDIIVEVNLSAADFTVLADSVKFGQILWSVLQNAIKFSVPGGAITIASSNPAECSFLLEIRDRGRGIDPAFIPSVFDPFQQCPRGNRRGGGLGLGMYIARGLAEAQHATLTVKSDGVGLGAAFQLTLPIARGKPSFLAPSTEMDDAPSEIR